jgi:ligand-binding sensor domain-containing protein
MILKRFKYIILPLLFSSGSFVFGQLTSEWELFNEENSFLPNNTIRCLETDHHNNIWVGTDWGLAKYSNGNWEIFNTDNSGLTDNSIRAIDSDSENNIWIGTTLGGLFKFDGSNWNQYNTSNSDIASDFVKAISVDSLNRVWVGTIEGLSLFDGNEWQTWTVANSDILSNNINAIAQGKNQITYVGTTNGGVLYIQNGVVNNYTLLQNGLPDNSIISVQVDQLGNPWFASAAQGFFTDAGNLTWLAFNVTNSALPTNSLKCMFLDNEQNFYIGTQLNGLVIRTNDNDWRNYTKTNSPLPDDYILSITKDSLGYVWIGTFSEGLVRLKEGYSGLDNLNQVKLEIYPVPAAQSEDVFISMPNPYSIVALTDQQGRSLLSEYPINGKVIIPKGKLVPGRYSICIYEGYHQSCGALVIY